MEYSGSHLLSVHGEAMSSVGASSWEVCGQRQTYVQQDLGLGTIISGPDNALHPCRPEPAAASVQEESVVSDEDSMMLRDVPVLWLGLPLLCSTTDLHHHQGSVLAPDVAEAVADINCQEKSSGEESMSPLWNPFWVGCMSLALLFSPSSTPSPESPPPPSPPLLPFPPGDRKSHSHKLVSPRPSSSAGLSFRRYPGITPTRSSRAINRVETISSPRRT